MPPDTSPSPGHERVLVYLEPRERVPRWGKLPELPQFDPNFLAGFEGPLRSEGK